MPAEAIADLDRRLGIPGLATICAGQGGLARVRITGPAAMGEVYLHGGHVTAWQPRGAEEVLFVSARSHWEDGRPIRGGVPICFPWFADRAGDPKAPAHGFVRARSWQLEAIEQMGDAVTVRLTTQSDASTKAWWPADFRLEQRIRFGARLSQELVVTNAGAEPLRFEEALHTYFQVGEIGKVRVLALDGVSYLDKTDQFRKKTQQGPIVITSQTDRVYLDTAQAVELEDQALGRRIRVAKENSRTTVVWNPWVEKAQAMPDFGDDEWVGMICIETCNVGDFAVSLPPGQQHTMKASIHVEALKR